MGHTITVRVDDELAEWLATEAEKTGVSQGKIVRDQLEKAKSAAAAQSFMRLAGAVRGGPRGVSTRKGFSRK
jgi:predicted transcriptional regulator